MLPPSWGEGEAVGGGGVLGRWRLLYPVAAVASLRLPGGRRAALVFSFSAGMSARCARLPEEGRKRASAPWSSAGAWPRLGGSSAPAAGAGRASNLCRAEGDAREPGRR